MRTRPAVCAGVALLRTLYQEAQPASVSLLVMSAMTDVAAFLQQDEARFVSKTASVVLVGGVVDSSFADPASDALVPDGQNFSLDVAASRYVFDRCQALGVRLIVVTREAAHAVSSLRRGDRTSRRPSDCVCKQRCSDALMPRSWQCPPSFSTSWLPPATRSLCECAMRSSK